MGNNEPRLGFKLNLIKTDQFAVFEENFIDVEKVDMTTSLNYGLDSDARIFVVVAKFTFDISEKPFMTIQVSCYFEIEESAYESFISDGKVTVPKNFVCFTAMHTVGTARGILHSKTENTPFNKFVLPPINIESMVPEDVVFE